MGFNCVRLTWPLDLATNDTLANHVSVRQSFQSLGLNDAIFGIQKNNPSIIDLPLVEALKAVVATLGRNGVMVILDNHLTKPGWCCSGDDRNGFFGDKYFDPAAWISGLKKMATIFNGVSNVVGMSLRNELRGRKQNVNDWYTYMQQAAEAVHSANPNVLVILSGLNFDKDLSFIQTRPVSLSFTQKLVFELHWYSWSEGIPWATANANDVCASFLRNVKDKAGFLLDKGFPLFVSEFGIDVKDNRYFDCLLSWLAETDVDWSIWALTGSYYLRQRSVGAEESFGVLAPDWINVRNPTFLLRLSLIQSSLRGPGSHTKVYNLIFHPVTGLCVVRKSPNDPSLILGQCHQTEKWSYYQNNLKIGGQPFCLQAIGAGQRVKLSKQCSSPSSKWQTISNSQMHLASTSGSGTSLCLDVDASNNVVSNVCKCLSRDSSCDPTSQWFKIVRAWKRLHV